MNSEHMSEKEITHLMDELQADLKGLFPVREEAATAYLDKLSVLAERVDEEVLQSSKVSELIGSCPVEVITTNHRNHARFMATVFALNLPSLLVRVIPWAYRVYTNRGVSLSYFTAECQAWINAVDQELDPAFAEQIRRVYSWMIDHHEDMKQLSQEIDVFSAQTNDWSEELNSLLSSLLSGDTQSVQQLAESEARDVADLPRLYMDLIQPVMYRIGSLWADGEVTVAQEHMATAVVSRIIAGTYQRLQLFAQKDHGAKGTAVVSCASKEFHELGARIIADLMELDGWDVTFMGANIPEEDFHHMVVDKQPDVVALSATVPSHLLNIKRMVNRIREEESLAHTLILAGGQALSLAPESAQSLNVDGIAHNGYEAREILAQWQEKDG